MSRARIAVRVDEPRWRAALAGPVGLVRQAASAALEGAAGAELSVLLTDDEAMRGLNAAFRHRDQPTNVLAFPAAKGASAYLGDIALGLGVCRREASEQGKALADHVRHLVIHGVLHLIGHDHDAAAPAARMEGLERRLLAAMGVADPYREAADGRRG